MEQIIKNLLCIIILFSYQNSLAEENVNEEIATQFFQNGIDLNVKRQSEEKKWVTSEKHMSQLLTHGERSQKSILIMHGLHESPYYMQNFTNYFFKQGYNVYSLLLPGHQSQNRDALSKVSYKEWVAAAEQGFEVAKDIGNDVEVLGYSTGGTLATYLALKYPKEIKKMYLISPALSLSYRVAISSIMMGWTSVDSEKVCRTPDSKSIPCRFLEFSDAQLEQMLREGLNSSLAAGHEVRRLIDFVRNEFKPKQEITDGEEFDRLPNMEEIFVQLKIPILMVGSESDNVVEPMFNNKLMAKYSGEKINILYPKKLNISHIAITKTQSLGFEKAHEVFNPNFDDILSAVQIIMNK